MSGPLLSAQDQIAVDARFAVAPSIVSHADASVRRRMARLDRLLGRLELLPAGSPGPDLPRRILLHVSTAGLPAVTSETAADPPGSALGAGFGADTFVPDAN